MTGAAWLAALVLSIGGTAPSVIAAPAAEPTPTLTITVAPRSASGAVALVYLDGPIDAGSPARLARTLAAINGKVTIWLNSPGGNLFAGMQLGRTIRQRGASTHIIDSRTLLPGECYSACAVAFLGGVYRFVDHGARYGVHRAFLPVERSTGERDLGHDLSAAIGSYLVEMAIDPSLLELWEKAAADEMYVLSPQEAKALGVVNDGREPPEWSVAQFPGGTMLQGRQTTAEGRGTVFFSCDDRQTTFGSVYRGAGTSAPDAVRHWHHVATIDSYATVPVKLLGVSINDGVVRTTFLAPPDLVRRAMAARRIGHLMKPSSRAAPIGISVDVDESSTLMVRTFLGSCLRRQARN
jgi:hypothetical protein